MKFNQLRILTYLTEAVKADLKITNSTVKDVLDKYWNEIPDNVDFIVNTLDGIDGKNFNHNNSKEKIGIHKVLRQMLPTKNDAAITKIAEEFTRAGGRNISVDDPMFSGFEIWGGSIYELYEKCGTIETAKSCMTDNKTLELIKFYDWINGKDSEFKPDPEVYKVKVEAVVKDDKEFGFSRALLWHGVEGTGGKPFMDRVYPDTMANLFHKYAESRGWAYRKGKGHADYTNNDLVGAKDVSIKIDIDNYNPRQLVPYMDTFVGIDRNSGILYNNKEGLKDLQKTDGTKLKGLPNWFLDNLDKGNIANHSVYSINDENQLIWERGIWKDGEWQGGTWKGGIWMGGAWNSSRKEGVWEKGVWQNGIWQWGTWEGGTWEKGAVIYCDWKNGTWENGLWQNGTWEKGTWEDGTWVFGHWYNGIWEKGLWEGGIWENGTWKGGTWESGTWKVGLWIGGKIYDPQGLGKKEYVDTLEWDGDFIIATEGITPQDYFGTPKGPYKYAEGKGNK